MAVGNTEREVFTRVRNNGTVALLRKNCIVDTIR